MAVSINLKEDICPISEFRANTNALLKKVREFHRPLVLTQNGKSSAIVLDIGDFQDMVDEMELMNKMLKSKKQIENGEIYTNDEVHQKLMERFKNG